MGVKENNYQNKENNNNGKGQLGRMEKISFYTINYIFRTQ